MTSQYSSVRAIVFDAVGTLIYPDPPVAVAYHELGRQHGSRLTQDAIAANFALAIKQNSCASRTSEQQERWRWRQIVADVFTDVDESESLFESLWHHFAQASHWAAYDDVAETLAAIKRQGFITAIGSNFDNRLLDIAKQLAPLDQLDAIFVSSQLGHAKPSIEFFRSIECKLQLQPSQLLIVGDDIRNDVEGGRRAGWHNQLVNRETRPNRDAALQSLFDLVPLLRTK